MRRLALLTILASSALHATSFTSATCGLGTITQTVTGTTSSSYTIPAYVDGNYIGFVGGNADVSGSLSPSTQLSVGGGGGFASDAGSFPDVSWGGGGEATYSQNFATAGPKRLGFISVLIDGFGGTWNASVGENGYPYGGVNNVMAPFELGVGFQVYLSANGGAGGGPGPSPCGVVCAAGDSSAGISFLQLFEADGITEVPYFAVVTPEPASWRFLLFGLAACAVFMFVLERRLRLARGFSPELEAVNRLQDPYLIGRSHKPAFATSFLYGISDF